MGPQTHKLSVRGRGENVRPAARWLLFAAVTLAVLLAFAPSGYAQSSIVDTFRIVNVTGVHANDTFNLDLYIRNIDTLSAFNFRLVWDTSVIEPVTVQDTGSLFQLEPVTFFRSTRQPIPKPANDNFDSLYTWEQASGSFAGPGVLTFIAFDRSISTTGTPNFTPIPPPSSAFKPGGGVTVRMRWHAKAYATPQTTTVELQDDLNYKFSYNTLLDFRAVIFKKPTLTPGAITITSGGGTQTPHSPVIPQPDSPVSGSQGDLLTFNVSATDPDGDSLSLLAFGLPSGAQFTPANPVLGKALASGTFRWTPSFSQSGSFVVSFQATDSSGLTSTIRNVTINVASVPRDQLFTTSTPTLDPQGGVPGATNVVIPVDFVEVQTVYGVQFDFVYDPDAFSPTALQPTNRLDGFTIYDDLGQHHGRLRVVAFSVNNDPIPSGSTSVLFNVIGNIPSDATPGVYDITFENAFESVNPDPNVSSVDLATENGKLFVDFNGDVNLDGRVDVADAVSIVGYILGDHTLTQRQFVAANVNGDFFVDVFDLVEIVNIIYGTATYNVAPTDVPATLELLYDPHDGPYGSYRMSGSLPSQLAGAQFQIKFDKHKLTLDTPRQIGLAANAHPYVRDHGDGSITILLMRDQHYDNSLISAGNGDLLRIPVLSKSAGAEPTIYIEDARLADPTAKPIQVAGIGDNVPRSFALAQNYPNPFNAATTITFSLDAASVATRARLEIFNVLGQRVRTLTDGVLPAQRSFSYTWNATDENGHPVASGVYFYRLTLDDKQETRKMVLLK